MDQRIGKYCQISTLVWVKTKFGSFPLQATPLVAKEISTIASAKYIRRYQVYASPLEQLDNIGVFFFDGITPKHSIQVLRMWQQTDRAATKFVFV
jgi:hypothetical protein